MPLGAERTGRPAAAPPASLAPTPPARFEAVAASFGLRLRLRLDDALRRTLDGARDDLERGLATPFLIVAFAVGAAIYFVLPREPWLPATVAAASAAVLATAVARTRGAAARGLATLAAVLAGLACGALETARVAAPRLDHERTVTLTGRVVDVDATQKGGTRLTLDVAAMEAKGLRPEATPTRVSATLTRPDGFRPQVGDGVRLRARLKPPEGPAIPGGYDFARRAWFEGRGASGYALGRAEPVDLGAEGPLARSLAAIGRLRHAVAERVRATLPGASGTIAAALMVGEQRAIPESAAEPLRASGLTHIVSISGLHMSLVGGGVIVAVRLFLVLFPALALRISAKKWAAAAAFLAVTAYLLLSGNQVAALRSHLMLSIALLAVMVDRPAITLHTVAVSAFLILAVDPASVMEPSFLMSYLAVVALVGGYDAWRTWRAARPPAKLDRGPIAATLAAAFAHAEGLAVSSLIAGLATAPVIAAVFYRGAPYSILANMIVLPVTGLVIMPAAVLSALAMPFGLDPWPLAVMGAGIDVMVAVARWTAALPGGAGLIGAPHWAAMPLGIAAVLWLSMWRSRLRFLGLLPAVLAAVLTVAGPHPDIVVGRHGTAVAVRGPDGRLAVLAPAAERFDVGIWLAADADPRPTTDASLAAGWRCDRIGCAYARPTPAGEETLVAVVRHPAAFAEDCRRAAVVVTTLVAPAGCADRAEVFDRIRLAETGAVTLNLASPAAASPSPDVAPDRPTPPDPTADLAPNAAPPDPLADPTDADPTAPTPPPPGAANPVRDHPSPTVADAADPFWDDRHPPPRHTIAATTALPRFARPWTPSRRSPSPGLTASPSADLPASPEQPSPPADRTGLAPPPIASAPSPPDAASPRSKSSFGPPTDAPPHAESDGDPSLSGTMPTEALDDR